MAQAPYIEHVTCHDGNDYVCVYEFPLDAGKRFCYRSRTSFNAFFHNHKKKRFIDKKNGLHYYAQDAVSWDIGTTGKYPFFSKLKIIRCGSIYEFFEAIGYSYKKGKYIQN